KNGGRGIPSPVVEGVLPSTVTLLQRNAGRVEGHAVQRGHGTGRGEADQTRVVDREATVTRLRDRLRRRGVDVGRKARVRRAVRRCAGHAEPDVALLHATVRGARNLGVDERGGTWSEAAAGGRPQDRKSTRLNSSHGSISYAVFCLKKKRQGS